MKTAMRLRREGLVVLVPLLGLTAGCGASQARFTPTSGEARSSLETALTAWRDGKAVKTSRAADALQPTDEMTDRLILPISNVCVACLREGIVDNADGVDGAMIFGIGYAPFRGGPLNYARSRGTDNVVSTLRALAEKFGGRFAPDAACQNRVSISGGAPCGHPTRHRSRRRGRPSSSRCASCRTPSWRSCSLPAWSCGCRPGPRPLPSPHSSRP